MKHKIALVTALLLALSAAPSARAQKIISDLNVVANEDAEKFGKRLDRVYELSDWIDLQRVGHARRVAHPTEVRAWEAEGLGAYANGDVDAAIVAYEGRLRLGPNAEAETYLANARVVRRKYPDLQLKPIEFGDSDATLAQRPWSAKARELLKQKNYDEIERVAAELQSSNAGDAARNPFLQTFFNALASAGDNFAERQSIIEAWRAAKPASDLARLAEIEFWVAKAYDERGGGAASTITPAMSARMDDALKRAAKVINELPASANTTPLTFMVMQNWAQLSGAGRPFLDAIFAEGAAKFPRYVPIYQRRTVLLLPRWFGAPGEWEAMAAKRADAIGGTEGDVLYALVFISAYGYVRTLSQEPEPPKPYNFARFWRGMDALRAQNPDSIDLRTLQIYIGDDQAQLPATTGGIGRAQSALREPGAEIMEGGFANYRQRDVRREFSLRRLALLAADKKSNW